MMGIMKLKKGKRKRKTLIIFRLSWPMITSPVIHRRSSKWKNKWKVGNTKRNPNGTLKPILALHHCAWYSTWHSSSNNFKLKVQLYFWNFFTYIYIYIDKSRWRVNLLAHMCSHPKLKFKSDSSIDFLSNLYIIIENYIYIYI